MQGLLPTVLADIFSPNARYTGASVALHVTTFAFAAVFPSATSALRSAGHHQPRLEVFENGYNAFNLAVAGTVVCVLSALSAWYMLCSRFVPFGLQPLHMRECVQVSFERSEASRHRVRSASRHRHHQERRSDGHQEGHVPGERTVNTSVGVERQRSIDILDEKQPHA